MELIRVAVDGGCTGGDCPAIYLDKDGTSGVAAIQATRAGRGERRQMLGWRRGEVAGFISEDTILAAADEIRARRG